MKKNNIGNNVNILTVLVSTVILIVFTLYANASSVQAKSSLAINFIFLFVMIVIILATITVNIGKMIRINTNLKHAVKMLRNSDALDEIDLGTELDSHFRRFLSENEKSNVSCDITEYINIGIINGIIRKSMCESISGTMTGLGLLGTFLGLIIGLKDFNASYDNIQNSIVLLLNGIKTSFLTSIYGVVYSILFNKIYRGSYSNLINSLEEFQNEFENVHNDINSRMIASQENQEKILGEMLTTIEKTLMTFSENVTAKFDSTMNTMTINIENSMNNISRSIGKYLDAATDKQHNQLKTLVNDYLTQMNENVLGGELNELRSVLGSINELGNALKGNIESLNNDFQNISESMRKISEKNEYLNEKMIGYIDSINNYQGQITESNRELTDRISILTDRYAEHTDYSEKLGNAVSGLTAVCSKLSIDADKLSKEHNEIIAEMRRLITEAEETGSDVNDKLISCINSLESSTETIYRKNTEITAKITEMIDRDIDKKINSLERVSECLETTSNSIETAYSNMISELNSGLDKTFNEFDTDTSRVIVQFSALLDNIRDTTDMIPIRLNEAVIGYFEDKKNQKELLDSIINEENNSFSEAEADEISNIDPENAVMTAGESDDKNEEADEKLLAVVSGE